jgi:hypothetical protein
MNDETDDHIDEGYRLCSSDEEEGKVGGGRLLPRLKVPLILALQMIQAWEPRKHTWSRKQKFV